MLTIESFFKGLGDGSVAEIFREHVRPRDRLQHDPMSAHRREQRDDQEDMGEFAEHVGMVGERSFAVKSW